LREAVEESLRGLLPEAGPGEDVRGFLQGLVTNDVSGSLPVWAALLTAQGKVLFDFLIWGDEADLLLDSERDAADASAITHGEDAGQRGLHPGISHRYPAPTPRCELVLAAQQPGELGGREKTVTQS
jgi:hypothetical protein